MSKKSYFLFVALLLSVLFVIIQAFNVSAINKKLNITRYRQLSLEDYAYNSFFVSWKDSENEAINFALPFLEDYSYVVYLPAGLCRSCFSTLLFAFQDHSVSFETILILCETNDLEVKAACNSRGIHFISLNSTIEGLSDIIVTRNYNGVIPMAMKYNLERDYIFSVFLSERHHIFPIQDD